MKKNASFLASFLILAGLAAQGQRIDGIYNIACIVQMTDAGNGRRTAECTTHPRENAQIGIQGKISFNVSTTHELMDQEGAAEVTDLILFVDGEPLPGTHPVVEQEWDEPLPQGSRDEGKDTDWLVTFRLTFPITRDLSTDKGKESWTKLLGGASKNAREVPVSMGLINGPPLPSPYKAEFVRLSSAGLVVFIVIAAALGIGFWAVAAKTGALRDKEPLPRDAAGHLVAMQPQQRTYSLSRTQIALWTLLVVYAYLFIWTITGEYNTEIPRTILAILGISAGTYAVGASVDKEKAVTKDVKVTRTESVSSDLFSGDNGASLHRVQFGLWSVVLMIIFVVTVYDTLAMPEFNASLLGLMGISSAAYAGMKIPETK